MGRGDLSTNQRQSFNSRQLCNRKLITLQQIHAMSLLIVKGTVEQSPKLSPIQLNAGFEQKTRGKKGIRSMETIGYEWM